MRMLLANGLKTQLILYGYPKAGMLSNGRNLAVSLLGSVVDLLLHALHQRKASPRRWDVRFVVCRINCFWSWWFVFPWFLRLQSWRRPSGAVQFFLPSICLIDYPQYSTTVPTEGNFRRSLTKFDGKATGCIGFSFKRQPASTRPRRRKIQRPITLRFLGGVWLKKVKVNRVLDSRVRFE